MFEQFDKVINKPNRSEILHRNKRFAVINAADVFLRKTSINSNVWSQSAIEEKKSAYE